MHRYARRWLSSGSDLGRRGRRTLPILLLGLELLFMCRALDRRRREQDALFAHFLVVVGEDALRTLLEAITQNSEQPLARLPLKWRERAIAAFRQVPLRRGKAQIVPLRPSS